MEYHTYPNGLTEPLCVLSCSTYDEYVRACSIFNREPSSVEGLNHDFYYSKYLVGRAFQEHTFHCGDSGQHLYEKFKDVEFIPISEYLADEAYDLYKVLGMNKI